MVGIDSSGCHESAGFDDAAKQHWRALEVDLLDDFCQQLQASGVPAQEEHIMPVGKFEKPENTVRTPIYNSGGG